MKKLVGKTDIEDALKRLDKLTQDEVRMATAQLLKITHGVDDKVTRIYDCVKSVNDKVMKSNDGAQVVHGKVMKINDGVKGVDSKVMSINEEVKGVNDKVKNVSDTVNLVLNGASCSTIYADSIVSVYMTRWKRDQSNHATDSTRVQSNHATHAEQC